MTKFNDFYNTTYYYKCKHTKLKTDTRHYSHSHTSDTTLLLPYIYIYLFALEDFHCNAKWHKKTLRLCPSNGSEPLASVNRTTPRLQTSTSGPSYFLPAICNKHLDNMSCTQFVQPATNWEAELTADTSRTVANDQQGAPLTMRTTVSYI